MIGFRHMLQPIRATSALVSRTEIYFQKARIYFYKFLFERRFRDIPRGNRTKCWCGGELLPLKHYQTYGVCSDCGCYVNRRPPLQESLAKVYSLGLYWYTKQRLMGIPTIEKRAALYRSDGRLKYWLNLVERYGPNSGRVIEVGCAPGVLLEELHKRGYECVGVEISPDVSTWIRLKTGLNVISGFFPGVDLPMCNLFLSFDVLEHSPSPEHFMKEVNRVLLPNGIAIIQTAIDRYEFDPPFGNRSDIFDDIEHMFLFTDRGMDELARRAGLEIINNKERLWLAGEICVLRKPG